jgi:hypothetical protein
MSFAFSFSFILSSRLNISASSCSSLLVSLGGFRLVFPERHDRCCRLASLSLHSRVPAGGSRGLSDGTVP